MECHSLDQAVRHLQLLVFVLVTCYRAQPTTGSTSNYSALLLFCINFVILLFASLMKEICVSTYEQMSMKPGLPLLS